MKLYILVLFVAALIIAAAYTFNNINPWIGYLVGLCIPAIIYFYIKEENKTNYIKEENKTNLK